MYSMIIEHISPTMAAQYLAQNTMNRPVRPAVVRDFAEAIKRGEWKMNGEPIKFASDGRLLDGQHRLNAIIASGVSINAAIIRGLDAAVFDTLDQGKKRTGGDILAIAGEKNTNILAAVLRTIISIEKGGVFGRNTTTVQIEDALVRWPSARKWTNEYNGNKAKAFATSCVPAVMTMAAERHGDGPSERFMDGLGSGANLDARSPVLTLRERLIESHTNRIRKLSTVVLCAYTIKAWNAYLKGRPLGLLRFKPGEEEFPTIL